MEVDLTTLTDEEFAALGRAIAAEQTRRYLLVTPTEEPPSPVVTLPQAEPTLFD